MSLLIDDLIVLLSKHESPLVTGQNIDAILAGVVFSDLLVAGAVTVPDPDQKKPRVEITEGAAPSDPLPGGSARPADGSPGQKHKASDHAEGN